MTEVSTDPSLLTQLGAQFEKMGDSAVEVTTTAPISNEVYLPGGFISKEGILVKTARVRELNGADEEALASAGNNLLQVILSRGLVELGGDKVTSTDLDNLLSGDRDAIVLGIRKVTFGNEIIANTICPSCAKEQELTLDIDKDIKVKELDNPVEDRSFLVTVKAGDVVVNLPNGITQKKLVDAQDKSTAEAVTVLLGGCIASINGTPPMGRATALALSISDRQELVSEIANRNPGPRLQEVSKACEACGNSIGLPLSLAALFRL
jgi:hypothetical protein